MLIYSVTDLKNQLVQEGNSSLVKPYEPDPVRLQGLGVKQTPSTSHLKPASFSKINRQQKVLQHLKKISSIKGRDQNKQYRQCRDQETASEKL